MTFHFIWQDSPRREVVGRDDTWGIWVKYNTTAARVVVVYVVTLVLLSRIEIGIIGLGLVMVNILPYIFFFFF